MQRCSPAPLLDTSKVEISKDKLWSETIPDASEINSKLKSFLA